jgi:uncharacterized protein (DUF58 family)
MLPKEIFKKIKRIEIQTNRLVNDLLAGEYHSIFKGRGMEFAEVREYTAGDDIRTVDWNVSARLGSPFVKVFEEERELTVFLVVDASGSGRFGSGQQMKGELAAEICAVLAFSAIKNNDRVGLIIFTDRVEKFIPPKKGRKHVLRVVRELLYFRPEGRGTDVPGALDFLSRVSNRHAIVFLISDFLGGDLTKSLRSVSRRHDVIAIAIEDPRETRLPAVGLLCLEDPETGDTLLVDTSDKAFLRAFEEESKRDRERLEEMFRAQRIDAIRLRTDESYVTPLVSFFQKRMRAAARS